MPTVKVVMLTGSTDQQALVLAIGAGCAGLSAASDLCKLGFGVTVYDALDQAGGTTLAGVPLPDFVLDIVAQGGLLPKLVADAQNP